jgi:hypothetical protein
MELNGARRCWAEAIAGVKQPPGRTPACHRVSNLLPLSGRASSAAGLQSLLKSNAAGEISPTRSTSQSPALRLPPDGAHPWQRGVTGTWRKKH